MFLFFCSEILEKKKKKCQSGTDLAAAERLLRLAQSKFQEALETQTRNPDVLCNLGIVTMRLLECTTDWKSLDLDRDPVLAQIESYFLRAESECAPEMQSIRSKVCFLNGMISLISLQSFP